jgi:hypothetical protein
VKRFHIWYDTLQEPFRMLMMFALVTPGLILVSQKDVRIIGVGFVYIIFLLFTRWFYLSRDI